MSYRGNLDRLEADAETVVERLLSDRATITSIMREYHVGYGPLRRLYHARTTAAQRAEASHRRCVRAGKAGGFQVGHVPCTAGRRGIHRSPATEFKTGCLRGQAARNWRPLGSITVRNDKPLKRQAGQRGRARRRRRRKWIKVADAGRIQDRWIPLARYVWARARGPIPPRMCVIHLDGDTLNCSLDNLMLVSRRGHLAAQMARDPGMNRRLRRAAGAAAKLRHHRNRELRRLNGPVATVWECRACGNEIGGKVGPGRCNKCGGSVFEKIARRLTA